MEKSNEKLNNRQRELLLELYIEGLDEADDEKVAKVLQFNLRDETLDAQIDKVNLFFAEEADLSEMANDARIVRELARESFSSAFEPNDKPLPPLTVGDVAKQLAISRNVSSDDELANRSLLENETTLPKVMSLNEIKRLANDLKIAASNLFWRKFHGAAMLLRSNRSQEIAMLAARQKRLKKQKDNERRNETENQ